MNYTQQYEYWKNNMTDADLRKQLFDMSEKDIQQAFSAPMTFGTAGLREVMGPGPGRMNIYTIRQATYALSQVIPKDSQVCIAYDTRHHSRSFAIEAGKVLAAQGIRTYLFDQATATPILSFAVRKTASAAGIVITASHNPGQYNGYKVYGSDGCQLTEDAAHRIESIMPDIDPFKVTYLEEEQARDKGLFMDMPEDINLSFLHCVISQSRSDIARGSGMKVLYTPLNGTGLIPVTKILSMRGVEYQVVEQQSQPDGDFPTCPYPNPELEQVYEIGLTMAEQLQPDILLATDPDADRVGVGVNKHGDLTLLTGNETGLLLMEYLLEMGRQNGTLPGKPVIVKSIVTTDMAIDLATAYHAEVINVLTGFKYIGEQIAFLEERGEADRFLFGFEESCGYLTGIYCRDKDSITASMLIVECAAWHKSQGRTLIDGLTRLYERFGYFSQKTLSYAFDDAEIMNKKVDDFRHMAEVDNRKVLEIRDYLSSLQTNVITGEQKHIDLPSSNVVSLSLDGNAAIIVRPSGTEPKLKIYLSVKADDKAGSEAAIDALHERIDHMIQ